MGYSNNSYSDDRYGDDPEINPFANVRPRRYVAKPIAPSVLRLMEKAARESVNNHRAYRKWLLNERLRKSEQGEISPPLDERTVARMKRELSEIEEAERSFNEAAE